MVVKINFGNKPLKRKKRYIRPRASVQSYAAPNGGLAISPEYDPANWGKSVAPSGSQVGPSTPPVAPITAPVKPVSPVSPSWGSSSTPNSPPNGGLAVSPEYDPSNWKSNVVSQPVYPTIPPISPSIPIIRVTNPVVSTSPPTKPTSKPWVGTSSAPNGCIAVSPEYNLANWKNNIEISVNKPQYTPQAPTKFPTSPQYAPVNKPQYTPQTPQSPTSPTKLTIINFDNTLSESKIRDALSKSNVPDFLQFNIVSGNDNSLWKSETFDALNGSGKKITAPYGVAEKTITLVKEGDQQFTFSQGGWGGGTYGKKSFVGHFNSDNDVDLGMRILHETEHMFGLPADELYTSQKNSFDSWLQSNRPQNSDFFTNNASYQGSNYVDRGQPIYMDFHNWLANENKSLFTRKQKFNRVKPRKPNKKTNSKPKQKTQVKKNTYKRSREMLKRFLG